MTTPGMSLFQGAESIKVNTSLERAEEEEALADQRRRNEELGNLLQNAFDDLDDDETTIDSTTNFQSDALDNHYRANDQQRHHERHQERQPAEPAHDYAAETEKLQLLLAARTNELEHIKQTANEEFKKRDELQKRLIIAEAELDRALAAKKNTHELLVESKEKCSNLESTVAKVRHEKKALETENNTLLGKLETAQTLLSDIQRKYDMVERDLNKHNDRNAEVRRKQMEDRHRAEVEMMQQQMEQLSDKLDKKTTELDNMNTRYHALQNSHETMLVDKASRINDLSGALNEAQKKCEELLAKQDYFQENVRLQKLVARLQEQIGAMEKTIGQLNERLEYTSAELDVMDSVLHQHNLEDTPRRLSQTQGRVVGSTPLNTNDRIGNLKDELYRALANVKGKREELRRMQLQLEEKQAEVRELRNEENKALVQITTLKEDKVRLENRIKIIAEERAEEVRLKADDSSATANVMQTLKEDLQQLQAEKDDWVRQRSEGEQARKQLDALLKNFQVDLEELKQEHDSLKLNCEQLQKENENLRSRASADESVRLELEKHKFLLKDAQAECSRLKGLYVEISNAKEALSYELSKLRQTDVAREVQEQRDKATNLQRALHLAELKATELTKILETEKLSHERDLASLREKLDQDRANQQKTAKDNSNNCTKCIDYLAEITKFEIQNLKLANINSVSKQQIDELARELKDSQERIAELREKLALSDRQQELIAELKTKAEQFEQYISSQASSEAKDSPATQPQQSTEAQEPGGGTISPAERRRIETRLRDEMAKVFAGELKRMQVRVHQTEEKWQCVQREYEHLSGELHQRQNEVDLLKQAILAEREKMAEILKHKDSECHELLQRQAAALQKCRDELYAKTKRVGELAEELAERQSQIEAERQSMKAVMLQWEQQRKSADDIESEWRANLQDLRLAHEGALASWQTKYNSAKRTAANYKRYAEDKETHMLKEYDRLKCEYDASLAKIEVHMRKALERKNREMRDALAANEKKQDMGHNKENNPRNQ